MEFPNPLSRKKVFNKAAGCNETEIVIQKRSEGYSFDFNLHA